MKFILERSRYLTIVGVISLLIAAVAAFAWGALRTVHTVMLVISTLGSDAAITIEFIEIIDSFLIATTILIFTVSLYEMSVADIDVPDWMVAHNIYELKAKLSSMAVLVMGVKFLQKVIEIKDASDLMQTGIAIAIVSAVLIAFGYFGNKKD